MRTTALLLILIASLAGLTTAQTMLVNEVGTGTTDYVEYLNVSNAAVALGGYQVWFGNVPSNTFGYGVPAGAMVNPNRCLIFTDNGGGLPTLQAGTAAYNIPANTYKWMPGDPGSCSILDASGNGLDFFAWGSPNPEKALKGNGGTPTNWVDLGAGAPKWGPEFGVNTNDTFIRHTRADTDSADDFSMTTAANFSPSYINKFQTFTNVDGLPPTASFTANLTSGVSPLTVRFSNTSTGDCQLGTVTWDFDATANPGINTSNLFNDSFIFANAPGTPGGSVVNYDVTLTLMDTCGGMAVSPVTTIAVTEPLSAFPQVYPYLEDMEGPTDPDTNTAMSPFTGWEVNRSSTNARVQTVDPRTVGAPINYDDVPRAQPTTVVMDSIASALQTTQEIVLHLDAESMFLLNGGAGFRIVLWAQHSGETPGFNDLIFFQDGVTMGDATDSQGNILTGTPGLDGLQEFFVADLITSIGPADTWTRLEYNFDSTFFTNNGITVPTGLGLLTDCRFVIRHESNGTYAGGEGLLIDRVQILTQSVTPPGWAGVPGFAVMDVSHAANVNDHFVGYPGDENGPHFTTITGQGTMEIDIEGEINQPILLLTGPLNPGVADYTGISPLIGKFDIGGPLDPMGIPTSLVVLADGSGQQLPPTLFNLIWNTGLDGVFSLSAALPPGIPSGFAIPMQAVIFRTGGVSLSNAVVLNIQ